MEAGSIHYFKCNVIFHSPGAWMFLGVTQLLSQKRMQEWMQARSGGLTSVSTVPANGLWHLVLVLSLDGRQVMS